MLAHIYNGGLQVIMELKNSYTWRRHSHRRGVIPHGTQVFVVTQV